MGVTVQNVMPLSTLVKIKTELKRKSKIKACVGGKRVEGVRNAEPINI